MSLGAGRDRRQGILPFVLKLGDREDVTARAGLPLVVETMRALRLDEVAAEQLPKKREGAYSQADKLESLVALVAAGGDRLEDILTLAEDKGLMRLLGKPFPSPDALVDFLGQFHDPTLLAERPEGKVAFVPRESAALLGLESINRALVHRGADRSATTATLDHDGTIIESHKREAKVAYEGTRGYQPLVAVWAEQQLVVGDEFRDGNVAGGEDPLSSVKRAFANLPRWVEQRFFRADSAAYYTPLLKYLVDESIGFSVSADMTKQLRACCEEVEEKSWLVVEKRAREIVEAAELEFAPGNWPKDAAPLRYVAIRFTPVQQEIFEARGVKFLAVVSNRRDLSTNDLLQWHWEKAGTIEHVHRVMKDELGAGVMPSGKFGANAAWFRINAMAFNVLTVLKRRALPERYLSARPKRLRFDVFTLPARLTVHQSQLSATLSAADDRARELITARERLLDLRENVPAPE